jgi:hypothetical protein
MKTLVSRISRNASRGAALLGLAVLFASAPAAFAQQSQPALKVAPTTHAASSGELRAVMFPVGSPLKVKVSFENPALDHIVLSIRNESGQVIHSNKVGRYKSYVSRLDLSALPDGDYTLHLSGKSSRYSQPFRIHTEMARLALVE